MISCALDEFRSLVNGLGNPIDDRKPPVRYLCALVSELAYRHVPRWEIDRGTRRAKLIPCEAYQTIVERGVPSTLDAVFAQLDLGGGAFVVEDRGVIALGVAINRLLFVGFRGTQFLFDWRINLRSRLVPVGTRLVARLPVVMSTPTGRLHSGFAEESMRISTRVLDAVRDSSVGNLDHVFLTGHSLGGAVAAIADNFVRIAPTSVCVLGAPRYSDLSAYATLPSGPPCQVRRVGDAVPTVPPRMFGYTDHPYESSTNGSQYLDPSVYASDLGGVARWCRFVLGRLRSHSVEEYRRELGVTAGAAGALLPLVTGQEIGPSSATSPAENRSGGVVESEKTQLDLSVFHTGLPYPFRGMRPIKEFKKKKVSTGA